MTRRFEINENGRVWDITDPNHPKLAGVMPTHVRTIESALRILQIVRPGCGVLAHVARLCRVLKNDEYAADLEDLDREIGDVVREDSDQVARARDGLTSAAGALERAEESVDQVLERLCLKR